MIERILFFIMKGLKLLNYENIGKVQTILKKELILSD